VFNFFASANAFNRLFAVVDDMENCFANWSIVKASFGGEASVWAARMSVVTLDQLIASSWAAASSVAVIAGGCFFITAILLRCASIHAPDFTTDEQFSLGPADHDAAELWS
jgi:hypothetical protein